MRFSFVAVFFVVTVCTRWSPAQDADPRTLPARVRAILTDACHRCHGSQGTVEGGLSYILDRQQLVSRGQIFPGDPAKSKLFRKLQRDEMPPEGEKPRPTRDDIALIKRWIELGAPDFNAAAPPRPNISTEMMLQAMVDELRKRDEADRRFIRFVTLTHLYNAGRSDDELQSFRNGISKLVNSLSWGRKVVAPVAVDRAKTILRIDLRDYKWTLPLWELIAGSDPYGIIYRRTGLAREVYESTACNLPCVRGDWLVAAASRPPLYHDLLQLPETEKELETLVRVDVEDDVRTSQTVRAGFNGSAVSRNNRVIERHESSYGYYWKSYDFAKNLDRQNIFAHPLGPGSNANSFVHDGGEIIFSLPNGLQGYMLSNATGRRLNKGPLEIVSDPKRPDRAVENGLSCMSCHVRGIIMKDDQVRAHIEKNRAAFPRKELDAILAIYPSRERFAGLVKEDSERYRAAVERCGSHVGITEPVAALTGLFESELDLNLAAAELGLEPSVFQDRLRFSAPLSRLLGNLQTPGGTVQRDAFAQAFPDLIRTLQLGTPSPKSGGSAGPVASNGGSLITLGGTRPFPEGFRSNKQVLADKSGLRMPAGVYVISQKSDYLNRDFKFEIVFTIKPGDKITFIGIGEATPSASYREPSNSVYLRIHPPEMGGGEVGLANSPSRNLAVIGKIPRHGTHRLIIEKKKDVVSFKINVNDDGTDSGDIEKTIPDIKEMGPFLNAKNTFIFFGGGETTFKKLRVVE